jgi:hypothetical protein
VGICGDYREFLLNGNFRHSLLAGGCIDSLPRYELLDWFHCLRLVLLRRVSIPKHHIDLGMA